MKKGVSFSVIPIIALLGVLALSIWAGYQLSIGSSYNKRYGDVFSEDPAVFKMETVKKILEDALKFSAQDKSIEIAANGGTRAETFWYCGYVERVPTPEEVKYHLSESIKSNLNAYIKSSEDEDQFFEIEVDIPKYTCAGAYENGESKCSSRDSSGCEDFWATATGNSQITLKEPNFLKEDDSISALALKNRFFWVYYKLYQDHKDGFSIRDLVQKEVCIPGEKIDRGVMLERIRSALEKVCNYYENVVFNDLYIDCSYDLMCFNEMQPSMCLNSMCDRGPFTEGLCDSPNALRVSGMSEKITGKIIYFEGEEECDKWIDRYYYENDDFRFQIRIKDSKFKIPTIEKELKNLIWEINGIISIDHSECPIYWKEYIPCPTTTTTVTTTTVQTMTTQQIVTTTGPTVTTVQVTTTQQVATTIEEVTTTYQVVTTVQIPTTTIQPVTTTINIPM